VGSESERELSADGYPCRYLETNGEGANLRPFIWVALLFLGKSRPSMPSVRFSLGIAPTAGTLVFNFYLFLTTRALVRGEALLTQVLFDHALRLRMKDSTEEEDKKEEEQKAEGITSLIKINIEEVPDQEPIATNDLIIHTEDVGIAPVEENGESSESTEVGSSNGSNKKGQSADKKTAADQEAQKTKGTGLAGKINVLMAADVESVLDGEDCTSADIAQADILQPETYRL